MAIISDEKEAIQALSEVASSLDEDEFNELFEKIKSGEIVVDNNSDMADPSKAGLEHVTFVK